MTKAEEILEAALSIDELFGSEGACPTFAEPGTNPKMIAITGRNAGGKSVLCKTLERTIIQNKHAREVMRIGMGLRTESGVVRGLMFGGEGSESTGRISGRVMLTTLSTSRGREHPHWIILDEPDIGVGEAYHEAIGRVIADFASDWPEHLQGLVVVSHARKLVAPMIEAGATSVRVGNDLRPVADWIRDGDPSASIDEFLSLSDRAHETKKKVDAAINAMREREKEASGPGR